MTRRRRPDLSFETWSSGREGHILFCAQDFRLACRRVKAGKSGRVHVYKSEAWAEEHEYRFNHTMLPVDEAAALARRFLG